MVFSIIEVIGKAQKSITDRIILSAESMSPPIGHPSQPASPASDASLASDVASPEPLLVVATLAISRSDR